MANQRKRGISNKPSKKQLYYFLRNLEANSIDINEAGIIAGYTVAEALRDFRYTLQSDEEKSFQEVRRVYDGFNEILQIPFEQGEGARLIADLRKKLESSLERDFDTSQPFSDSLIYLGLINLLNIRNGSCEERLRMSGIDLISAVKEIGPRKRRKQLTGDYSQILYNFTRSKGERR
ncbi:hypothetical protein HOD75_04060 [archaeon]|jgi:hypothetical protein|nr:hypothetical protein [Candidatus Woesearchaeota archaeon]MBT4135681.1 hypothetical protein [archaeon]MBT4242042.1 hypothetical protein [archaeon]MBT4417730.1 hypothetical protein [archaeon]